MPNPDVVSAGFIALVGVYALVRDRVAGVPSSESKLVKSLQGLVESQGLEIKQLQRRLDYLERYRIAVEAFVEVADRYSDDLRAVLADRLQVRRS